MNPLLWPRWLQTLAGAALLALAVWLFTGPIWKVVDWFNDREAVGDYKAETRAKVTGKVLEAERSANRNDAERRVVRERQTDELERAREEAMRANPEPVLAGPATRAVLQELRRQQDANHPQ